MKKKVKVTEFMDILARKYRVQWSFKSLIKIKLHLKFSSSLM